MRTSLLVARFALAAPAAAAHAAAGTSACCSTAARSAHTVHAEDGGRRRPSCAARRASTCASCSSAPTATSTTAVERWQRRLPVRLAARTDQRRAHRACGPERAVAPWSAPPARPARGCVRASPTGIRGSCERERLLNSQTGELVPVQLDARWARRASPSAAGTRARQPPPHHRAGAADRPVVRGRATGWPSRRAGGRPAPALRAC